MESATRVQILGDVVYISLYANALGKDINSSALSPVVVN